MTHRGPFQPLLFCDFVILCYFREKIKCMSQAHFHTSAKQKKTNCSFTKYVCMPPEFSWPGAAIFSPRGFLAAVRTLRDSSRLSSACHRPELRPAAAGGNVRPGDAAGALPGEHRAEGATELCSGCFCLGGSKGCQKSHESSVPRKNIGVLKQTRL